MHDLRFKLSYPLQGDAFARMAPDDAPDFQNRQSSQHLTGAKTGFGNHIIHQPGFGTQSIHNGLLGSVQGRLRFIYVTIREEVPLSMTFFSFSPEEGAFFPGILGFCAAMAGFLSSGAAIFATSSG